MTTKPPHNQSGYPPARASAADTFPSAGPLSISAELDQTRSHLEAIIANSEDAIISKTLDGTVTTWNAAAERLYGYTAAEIVGQSIMRVIPPELGQEEEGILARLKRGERIERLETVRVRKDGSRVEVSLTVSPVRDSNGVVVGAAKIAHDITERRNTERALKDEAAAMQTLNRIGQAVSSQLELESIVQFVTDEATAATGAAFGAFFYNIAKEGEESYWLYTLSGVPRESFSKFPMPRNTAVFAPTFRGDGVVRSDDITKDSRYGNNPPYQGMPAGHLPVCSYLAVPVKSRTGDVLGGLFFGHSQPGVFTDRSEHLVAAIAANASIAMTNAGLFREIREREERLEKIVAEREQILESERNARTEAERLGHLKDEFLATLSHELRTPLHAIHGWTVILRQPKITPEDRERGLEVIERNVRAQTQIMNDLLDMSSIISGKVHLEVQSIQLHEVIANAVEAVRQSAEAKEIRLTSLLDSGIGLVRGDPGRLQQVLWNLLTNAIKFTPKGGRVQVILERVNSHVEIMVEDSGIGIHPDFLPYVFDRFRQADASITRRHGGLGLGLSIVKNLVELHGGAVRVKSAGENQGSKFIVSLPVSHVGNGDTARRKTPAVASDPLETIDVPMLDKVKVLIVDDEPDGRMLIARILEGRGAQPVCAASAGEALDLLSRQAFDVLISDIGMPDVDGYELMRQVRAREGGTMPAIAVTAYARAEDRQRALLAGYQMHLSKPIEAKELIAGIASLLRLRQ